MAPAIREFECQSALESVQRKALIIDDNAQDLSDEARLLETHGFDTVKCRSYDEAVRLIERDLFDLVVMSQGSLAFEGRIVMRYLQRYMPYTPCIVTAQLENTKCRVEAHELGAEGYVVKPISEQQMRNLVHKLFGDHLVA